MRKAAAPKPNNVEAEIAKVIQRYDTDKLIVSTAYDDGGTEMLRGRLEGGVLNQMTNGDAMAARYAIWANTVRDNIIAGINAIKAGAPNEGYAHLIRAANSMSAFSDAQALLDPLKMGKLPE